MATNSVKINNVPNLRFSGYDRAWEMRRLGDVATNKSGKYNPENAEGAIKCIELEHLASQNGQLLGYIDGSQSGSIKNTFNKGDVLFGKLRPYLRKYLQAPFDGICSSEIWVLKGKNVSNDFLYRIVQTEKFIDLANQSSGSKMPRADWNVVENGIFHIPDLSEQVKISNFLLLIDQRIETQNKIIEQLETLIVEIRDKLLNNEIEFSDENCLHFPDWQEKELREIGNTYNGLTGKTKESFGKGRKYIQYKQIFDSASIQESACGLVQVFDNENQNTVKYGDILFTVSSETSNEIGMASVFLDKSEDVFLNSFCFGFRPNSLKELRPEYAQYFFRSRIFRNEIIKLAQGSTRYNMSKVEFLKLFILLPSYQEQTLISNCLLTIDKKIKTESNLLSNYQRQKQYLLKQMLI